MDPSLTKSGLATLVCNEVEKDLKEKLRSAGKKQMQLMIRTGKENNEVYWTKKGYQIISETKFAPGNFGSRTGFILLDMERIVDL